MKQTNVKKLVLLAMLSALTYMVTLVFPRIQVAGFLRYEPKDVVIVMSGFLIAPWAPVAIAGIVAILEMFTISETGWIGALMNFLSSLSFAFPAAIIYSKKRTLPGAVIGLTVGSIAMTATMLLWNWIVTPWYMYVPRSTVEEMLLPVFLPFNAVKAGLNTGLTLALYKPLTTALGKARLLPKAATSKGKLNIWVYIAATVLLIGSTALLIYLM